MALVIPSNSTNYDFNWYSKHSASNSGGGIQTLWIVATDRLICPMRVCLILFRSHPKGFEPGTRQFWVLSTHITPPETPQEAHGTQDQQLSEEPEAENGNKWAGHSNSHFTHFLLLGPLCLPGSAPGFKDSLPFSLQPLCFWVPCPSGPLSLTNVFPCPPRFLLTAQQPLFSENQSEGFPSQAGVLTYLTEAAVFINVLSLIAFLWAEKTQSC